MIKNVDMDHVAVANMLFDQGKPMEALARIQSAIDDDPEDIKAYSLRAYIHYHLENFKSALDDFECVLAVCPQDAWLHINIADIWVKLKGLEEAKTHLQTAKILATGNEDLFSFVTERLDALNETHPEPTTPGL